MAKKTLTQATYATDNIQSQADQVVGQASQLKLAFDQGDIDQKTYNNTVLLAELQAETAGSAGANAIGAEGTFGTNNVGDEIKAIKTVTDGAGGDITVLEGRVTVNEGDIDSLETRMTTAETDIDNLETADAQNVKLTGNQTVAGTKTFSSVPKSSVSPSATNDLTRKDYVDNLDVQNVKLTGNQSVSGTKTFNSNVNVPVTPTANAHAASKQYVDSQAPLTIPDGSITDQKLSDEPDQIKAAVRNSDYSDANRFVGNTQTLLACEQSEESITFVSGAYATAQVKLGKDSITSPVGTSPLLHVNYDSSQDMSKLKNGEAVADGDFILVPVTIFGTFTDFKVEIGTSTTRGVNEIVSPTQVVSSGFQVLKIKKSDFTETGTFDISNVNRVSIATTTTVSSQFFVDALQFVKADPENPAIPNPFQENGQRVFTINSGEWYVGREFGKNVIKELTGVGSFYSLPATKLHADNFTISSDSIVGANEDDSGIGWGTSSSDFFSIDILEGKVRVIENNVIIEEINTPPISKGDLVRSMMSKVGNEITIKVILNNDYINMIAKTYNTILSGPKPMFLKLLTNRRDVAKISASITELSHANTANFASVAGSLTVVYKNGAFTDDELPWGTYGLDTANGDVYFKISATQMIQVNGVIV